MSTPAPAPGQRVRHILSLSGGKDSTALAIYMRDRVPEMEYVFCDTGKELPETYEYLRKVETYLGKPVVFLRASNGGFDDFLKARRGFLPSAQVRWCTELLKIKPFEEYVGEDLAISYIAIRYDENRRGYISTKPNIIPKYPFIEDKITKTDVLRILEESGLGMPSYYEWRSRSGCYFCFFQQRHEWVGLLEHHPDLFELAKSYERVDPVTGERYTWSQRESLEELARPERIEQIKREFARRRQAALARQRSTGLIDILQDDESEGPACLICHL